MSLESLTKRLDGEVQKLLRENHQRAENAALSSDTVQFVPFPDFEAAAKRQLGIDYGWQKAFEQQTNFREGIVSVWGSQGRVPYGAFWFCSHLRKVTVEKVKRTWEDDEKAEIRRLWFKDGIRSYDEIAKGMHLRFGNRRNYLDKGPIKGAIKRFILREGGRVGA